LVLTAVASDSSSRRGSHLQQDAVVVDVDVGDLTAGGT